MYEQIARNKRRTFFMLLAFVALITLVATAIVLLFGGGWVGVVIAFVVAMGLAWGSYFNSDKIAIAASRAKPADEVEYRRYHNLVEGLCIAAGLPKPKLYVVNDPAPNAFATGRNPKHSAVAVTAGLLDTMNRVELEGVLAHELSHIKNYDILVTTVAVTAVGTIALISDIGLRFAFWGGMSDRRDNNGDSGPIGAVIAVASLAVLMLAPFAGYLMQMAMSRNREYLADASGVQLTRYPPGLISALEKLRDDHAVVHYATKATAQMWIEQPLETAEDKPGTKFNKLFDTHPPLEDRIKRLQEM
ncbi:MAG: zinc metalloprotease HtpX [Acidimicrobiia bacterium]